MIIESIESAKIFDIPVLNGSNFSILLLRYLFNVIITYFIVKVYYKYSQNKEYIFTFYAFNTLIFFMIYLMNNISLGVGFGFGLFAIFSILRYRTSTINIKEMTYLFMVITVALINAVVSPSFSYVEILFSNLVIIIMTVILEKLMQTQTLSVYKIIYEKIDNIKPENRPLLMQDLKERTGLNITNIQIMDIDFLRDVVNIKLYYEQEKNNNFGTKIE